MIARLRLPTIAATANTLAPATLRPMIEPVCSSWTTCTARCSRCIHTETLALDADPALTELVTPPDYRVKVERIFRLHLATFDWNCPQHITPRFTEAEISEAVEPLRKRLETLEAENAELRAKLAAKEGIDGSRTNAG
jgi:hypothetical protein